MCNTMELSKAIEILDLNVRQRTLIMPQYVLDALKLNIQASKRLITLRRDPSLSPQFPLPGEDPQ